MSSLIVAYLILVVAAPLVLSAIVSYRTLPEGRSCPLCADDTLRLVARWLDRISVIKPGAALERRWCPCCGWEGVSRNSRNEFRVVGADPSERSPVLSEEARSDVLDHEAMDLRRISVDGRQWRVLIQTWTEDDDQWYGRLLFSGPGGRMWVDRERTFSGSSPLDLLGQVLSLPEGVLTSRLREATSG